MDVTVVIPTHPARLRNGMLDRALRSVITQTMQPMEIIVVNDLERRGSAETRNHGLDKVRINAEWVAFLDSDDEWLSNHLEVLITAVADRENTASGGPVDVAYSGCRVVGPDGAELPLREEWGRFGEPFDADRLRRMSYIPVTSLVRAELACTSRFAYPGDSPYDDWGFYLGLLDRGAEFLHVPVVTWVWHHHGANTSGRPWQGDAA